MPKFRVEVSDTVTYARAKVIEVTARDEDTACGKARAMALNGPPEFFNDLDEQIDNTPWEAEIVK